MEVTSTTGKKHPPLSLKALTTKFVGYSFAIFHLFRQNASMSTNLLELQSYLSQIPVPENTPKHLICTSQNDDAKIAMGKPIPA